MSAAQERAAATPRREGSQHAPGATSAAGAVVYRPEHKHGWLRASWPSILHTDAAAGPAGPCWGSRGTGAPQRAAPHRDVVADHVKVSLPRVELDGKAARVAQRLGGAALVDHCRQSSEASRGRSTLEGASCAADALQARPLRHTHDGGAYARVRTGTTIIGAHGIKEGRQHKELHHWGPPLLPSRKHPSESQWHGTHRWRSAQ